MTDKPEPKPITFRVEEHDKDGNVIYENSITVEPDENGKINPADVPDIWEF